MVTYFKYVLAAAVTTFALHALAFQIGSVTLTGQMDITIPEDGLEHDFTYTLTNNAGESIFFPGNYSLTLIFLSGDLSDWPTEASKTSLVLLLPHHLRMVKPATSPYFFFQMPARGRPTKTSEAGRFSWTQPSISP